MNASAVGRISVPPPSPPAGVKVPFRVQGPRRPFAPARAEGKGGDEGLVPGESELAGAVGLAAGLKGLMGYAQDTCRLRAVSPTVQVVEYRSPERRRMGLHGVHTCKSPLCPQCAPKWQRTRSDEITQAVDAHGAEAVFFVTLTMRHNRKMRLALQHRLLTSALGNMWSGKIGQKRAAKLGGRPETIRAHDRTWSAPRGWHPHIHALLFVENGDVGVDDLTRLFDTHWPRLLAAALRRFKSLCLRIITRSDAVRWDTDERGVERAFPSNRGGCGRPDCRVCQIQFQGPRRELAFAGPLEQGEETYKLWREKRLGALPLPAGEQIGECPHFRERAGRLLGKRMFPDRRRVVSGLDADGRSLYSEQPVAIHDSALRVLSMLEPFTASSIRPTRANGAFVERMRDRDRLPKYLAKLGLELASSLTKLGHEGSDGVMHYSHWETARIACEHGHPLRPLARKAWSELFQATKGTQTITFSDREALGLAPDSYAEDGEPDEQRVDETQRVVGLIEATRFRERVAEREHGVLAELIAAFERSELDSLGYVDPPGELGRVLRTVAPQTGPPSTADPCTVTADGYLLHRPERAERGEVLSFDDWIARMELGETTRIGDGYREASALPSSESVLPDQLRRRLREKIGESGVDSAVVRFSVREALGKRWSG